jgi:hypothetical protein
VKAARRKERPVAEAKHLGKENNEQQPAQQSRDADIYEARNPLGWRTLPALAEGTERNPIQQRIQRHRDEVMGHDRNDEPLHDLQRRGARERVEPAGDRSTGDQ